MLTEDEDKRPVQVGPVVGDEVEACPEAQAIAGDRVRDAAREQEDPAHGVQFGRELGDGLPGCVRAGQHRVSQPKVGGYARRPDDGILGTDDADHATIMSEIPRISSPEYW